MEKSIAPTKEILKVPPPDTPPNSMDKFYNYVYSDAPDPADDETGRRNAVRPKVGVWGDGGYAIKTYFEDAEPKEFKVMLKTEAAEPEVAVEDTDAFNLYSDTKTKDEIDYEDEVESKPAAVAETEKPKLNYLEKRRIRQQKRDASLLPRLVTDLQSLQQTYSLTPAQLQEKLQDPTTKTATQRAKLQLYSLAISARKWAHRSQALAEEIAFAKTPEGKLKDEETLKKMEEEAVEKVKARKEKWGKDAEERKKKREGIKKAKMGNYEVGGKAGEGSRGRGGRGRGRGKGDGSAPDGAPAAAGASEGPPATKADGSASSPEIGRCTFVAIGVGN